MIKMSLKALLITSLSLSPLAHAITATDPVGVVKITIEAAASANQPTYSYLSTSMSQEVAYQGVVSAGGTGTITIAKNDWTVDQFKSVPYYVIIASGTREGEMLDIASNTANTLTLSGGLATENQNDLVGQIIRIHKHNTIASIFGANPAAGTVQKGDQDTADHIMLYNTLNESYDIYYYNNIPSVGSFPLQTNLHLGWVKLGASTLNASNTPIYPDDGFLYKRLPTSSFSISVSGTVISNSIKVPIIKGYNLVSIPYPIDKSITLSSSGLENNLQKGSEETADQVLVFNSANQSFNSYYYNNIPSVGSFPLQTNLHLGWVKLGESTVNASNTIIPSGKAIFILRKEGAPAFNWTFQNVTE